MSHPYFNNDYPRIGEAVGLTRGRLTLYIHYMMERWPEGQAEDYSREWAERFLKGYEYQYSDGVGRAVLEKLYVTA